MPMFALLLLACWIQDSPAEIARPASETPESGLGGIQNRVEVGPGGTLDLRLHNVDVFLALEMLSEQTGRNIVVQQGVTGSVSVVLRRVTFDEALAALLTANDLQHELRQGIIFVSPRRPEAAQPAAEAKTVRVFRLSYISAGEAESLIKPLLAEDDRVSRNPESAAAEAGGGGGAKLIGGNRDAGDDVLVIWSTPARIEQVAAALAEVDRRPQQVLVEATILRATLNEQNALGVEFNTLCGVDFQQLSAVSPGVGSITLGPVPQAQLNNSSTAVRTDFNNAVPQGGFTFGIVKDNVAAFVRALEQVTDVSVMANPKVLTLNKQVGEVIVGRRDGYLTTTVTETAAVQTVEFLETGTKLLFRPFILRDGLVRMEVHPEDSNGGLTAANLPFQETTEATTNILLRDGHTILIGGLFRERTTMGSNRVPFFGSLPVVKHLFGVEQDQTVREEVIILLTVHVLNQAHDEAASNWALDDAERLRVGARQGLMGTGRVQMADARLRRAVELAQEGRIDDALSAVRLSLSLNPRNIDAIHLKEELLERRDWSSDGSPIRTFLHEKLLHPPESPMFGRPIPSRVEPLKQRPPAGPPWAENAAAPAGGDPN
jgi:type II secretory pathway component GspD/PulD (secretin)